MAHRFTGFVLALAMGSVPVAAQQPTQPTAPPGPAITPLNGQTAEKTALDDAECKNAATQATGFVPGSAPPAAATPTGPSGQRLAGAARGAAAGAVVGEVQGNNSWAPEAVRDEHREDQAKTGAALGVMAGGSRTRQQRRQAMQAQQSATQQHAAAQTNWQSNYKSCLTQRGYSVP